MIQRAQALQLASTVLANTADGCYTSGRIAVETMRGYVHIKAVIPLRARKT